MNMYTQSQLNDLISCEKTIAKTPPRKFSRERGQCRLKFSVQSVEEQHQFTGYIRYNTKFEENFSVGLAYHPYDGSGDIHLVRCNGMHGEHRMWPHHDSCHIHLASAHTICAGLKENNFIELTRAYSSYQEAVGFFLNYVNIVDSRKHFEWMLPKPPLPLFPNY